MLVEDMSQRLGSEWEGKQFPVEENELKQR